VVDNENREHKAGHRSKEKDAGQDPGEEPAHTPRPPARPSCPQLVTAGDANTNDMAVTANPTNATPNTAAATPSPSRQAIRKTQATIAALVGIDSRRQSFLPLLFSKGEAVPPPL
jgi:hypothetical protein